MCIRDRASDQLVHLVFGILGIAEGDRAVGAYLGAGSHILPVGQLIGVASLGDGLVLGLHPTVMAEGAFFHHAAGTHGNVRGEGLFHAFRPDRIVPVEITGMVRAVSYTHLASPFRHAGDELVPQQAGACGVPGRLARSDVRGAPRLCGGDIHGTVPHL